jgi:hypothetical protein
MMTHIILSRLVYLGWWAHLFSLERWGCFLVPGVCFPNHMPQEGTDRIQQFWAVTDGPRYPG